MADTPTISPLRARPGVVRLYIWPEILRQRSRILGSTHHGHISRFLCIHSFPHPGSHGRNLSHARIVFLSHGLRAIRAVSLALLGNCRNRGPEHFDKKSDRASFPDGNHVGIPDSHGRPEEKLETPSSIDHAVISRRCHPVARSRRNPKSRTTHRP